MGTDEGTVEGVETSSSIASSFTMTDAGGVDDLPTVGHAEITGWWPAKTVAGAGAAARVA